jgi:hypothetical protein
MCLEAVKAPAQAARIRAVGGTATRVRDDVVAIGEACMLTTVREAAGPVAGVTHSSWAPLGV